MRPPVGKSLLAAILAAALGAALPLRADDVVVMEQAADDHFKIDVNKSSSIADKMFEMKSFNGFGATAPGFDKAFRTGSSDMMQKTFDFGGRNIYAPTLDFGKSYPVSSSSAFGGLSSFSGREAPLAMRPSSLSTDARLNHFDTILEDKPYTGREAGLVREAMSRYGRQSEEMLSKQLYPGQDKKTPTMSIDEVKGLLNKDVRPAYLEQGITIDPAPESPTAKPSALPSK